MSDYDPDVAAAFGVGSAPAAQPPPTPAYDPDVAGAFNTGAGQPPNPTTAQLRAASAAAAAKGPPLWNGPPELGLQNTGPIGYGLAGAGQGLANFAGRHGVTNPGILRDISNLPTAVGTVGMMYAPMLRGNGAAAPAEAPSAYAAEEAAETSRLADIRSTAESKGLSIRDTGSTEQFQQDSAHNQPIADNIVRQNFGLSNTAPLTPTMIQAVRSKIATDGAFGQIRQLPSVAVPDDAVSSILKLPPTILKAVGLDGDKIKPDGTMSGTDFVDASQALRAESNSYWKSPYPQDKSIARTIDNATDSLETGVGGSLPPGLNDSLNADRAKIAQTYNVERALQNNHVNVSALTRQDTKGAPLSGDLEMLAELGRSHPEGFTFTRTRVAQPGFIKSSLAKVAPAGLAALGAASPLGPIVGGGLGAAGGEMISNRLLKP